MRAAANRIVVSVILSITAVSEPNYRPDEKSIAPRIMYSMARQIDRSERTILGRCALATISPPIGDRNLHLCLNTTRQDFRGVR